MLWTGSTMIPLKWATMSLPSFNTWCPMSLSQHNQVIQVCYESKRMDTWKVWIHIQDQSGKFKGLLLTHAQVHEDALFSQQRTYLLLTFICCTFYIPPKDYFSIVSLIFVIIMIAFPLSEELSLFRNIGHHINLHMCLKNIIFGSWATAQWDYHIQVLTIFL